MWRRSTRQPPAANAGLLVGHSALRLDTMDDVDRPATASEIDAMRERLAEGMEAGALGFSTGLIYGPNKAATTDEVAAVAEVAGAAGGLYVTHMRNEHDDIEEAMEEAFEIGRRAGAGVVISHHKCAGRQNFGRSRDTLALLDKAPRAPGHRPRCLSLHRKVSTVLLAGDGGEGGAGDRHLVRAASGFTRAATSPTSLPSSASTRSPPWRS